MEKVESFRCWWLGSEKVTKFKPGSHTIPIKMELLELRSSQSKMKKSNLLLK